MTSSVRELSRLYHRAGDLVRAIDDKQDALTRVENGAPGHLPASLPMAQVEFTIPKAVAVTYVTRSLDALKDELVEVEAYIATLRS